MAPAASGATSPRRSRHHERLSMDLPDDLCAWVEESTVGRVAEARRVMGGASREAWFVDVARGRRRAARAVPPSRQRHRSDAGHAVHHRPRGDRLPRPRRHAGARARGRRRRIPTATPCCSSASKARRTSRPRATRAEQLADQFVEILAALHATDVTHARPAATRHAHDARGARHPRARHLGAAAARSWPPRSARDLHPALAARPRAHHRRPHRARAGRHRPRQLHVPRRHDRRGRRLGARPPRRPHGRPRVGDHPLAAPAVRAAGPVVPPLPGAVGHRGRRRAAALVDGVQRRALRDRRRRRHRVGRGQPRARHDLRLAADAPPGHGRRAGSRHRP